MMLKLCLKQLVHSYTHSNNLVSSSVSYYNNDKLIIIYVNNHSIPSDPKQLLILMNQRVFFSIGLLNAKTMHTVLNTRDLICIYNVA